jgi:hypothetical protein
MKMKHQVQYGTDSGIVSKQAAKKIRVLVADLTRTVQILESDIATKKTRMLDIRHQNLIDTIACLEDRLASIEHLRAFKYSWRPRGSRNDRRLRAAVVLKRNHRSHRSQVDKPEQSANGTDHQRDAQCV